MPKIDLARPRNLFLSLAAALGCFLPTHKFSGYCDAIHPNGSARQTVETAGKTRSGSASEPAAGPSAVTVTATREGEVTHVYVENKEWCEVTMTFEMSMANLKANVHFPYTTVFPPGEVTEAFILTPVKAGTRWDYSYTNYFKLGSNCVRHDDTCVYELPYDPGDRFKVTQGYNGKYSHKGSNQYAIDWQMPEGTLVHAARAGVVVRVKDDSDKGGGSMAFDPYNNYVLIRHDDGTLGHYCHLQKHGCLVQPGQRVETGDAIARSGNTGFSSGPHLHFCVFKTRNGRERLSIPVKFKTANERAITLVSGRTYEAAPSQQASTRIPTAETHSMGASTP